MPCSIKKYAIPNRSTTALRSGRWAGYAILLGVFAGLAGGFAAWLSRSGRELPERVGSRRSRAGHRGHAQGIAAGLPRSRDEHRPGAVHAAGRRRRRGQRSGARDRPATRHRGAPDLPVLPGDVDRRRFHRGPDRRASRDALDGCRPEHALRLRRPADRLQEGGSRTLTRDTGRAMSEENVEVVEQAVAAVSSLPHRRHRPWRRLRSGVRTRSARRPNRCVLRGGVEWSRWGRRLRGESDGGARRHVAARRRVHRRP